MNDWSQPPRDGAISTQLCAVERSTGQPFSYTVATVLEVDVSACRIVDAVSIDVSPLDDADVGLTVGVLAVSAAR